MSSLVVAGATLNQTPLDWEGNRRRIVEALRRARALGASVLCLPELCLTGCGCDDAFRLPWVVQAAQEILLSLLPETEDLMAVVGLPLLLEGAIYNAAAVLEDGKLAAFVCKEHIACDALNTECLLFRPWPIGKHTEYRLGDRSVPVGDFALERGPFLVQVRIGEDLWQHPLSGKPTNDRIRLILHPTAEAFGLGRFQARKLRLAELSASAPGVYVSANLLGNEAGRVIYDGSVLIAQQGTVLASGPRLSFRPWVLTAVHIGGASKQPAADSPREVTTSPGTRQEGAAAQSPRSSPLVASGGPPERDFPPWEDSPHPAEEEFTRGLALALFDYLRKSQAKGYVISLSGGADSSGIACLISIAVHLAYRELGPEGLRAALNHIPELGQSDSPRKIVGRILRCVYQPSRNSSEGSRRSAEAVASALGVPFAVVPIDPMVEHYVREAERVLGRPLSWQTDSVALQNIQARVRGPLPWLLANAEGKILIATGNRSEAIVGYATMDGDTCGGITPLGSVSKAFLRRWLMWLEKIGPTGFGPIPALAEVNRLAPSAELRPPEERQTDEGDLMPYEVLEAIELAIFRDRLPLPAIKERLSQRFGQYSSETLAQWIDRFLELCARNQWKRERLAPVFYVGDDHPYPWTRVRLPILSAPLKPQADAHRQSNSQV
jgi:NAD+ synthase (glutamine-hydrolysing)